MGSPSSIPCQVLVHFSTTARRCAEVLKRHIPACLSAPTSTASTTSFGPDADVSVSIFVVNKLIMHVELNLHVAADGFLLLRTKVSFLPCRL